MGRCPQRETFQSHIAGGAGDVVAFAYNTYSISHISKAVLGSTLTLIVKASRPYLPAQLPLSAFLLTLAPDLKFPTRTRLLSIKKTNFKKNVNVWDPYSDSPPPVYLNSNLCPVLRVIPNSSLSSLTVNRPLCAKLINRCFRSIGNSFFQGILPSLCVTHVLGQFVTDLLGSYPFFFTNLQ
jgi:hypothetical protein